nr:MAG TPA: hypothetical protein [Caudoviricetes sp.]
MRKTKSTDWLSLTYEVKNDRKRLITTENSRAYHINSK